LVVREHAYLFYILNRKQVQQCFISEPYACQNLLLI